MKEHARPEYRINAPIRSLVQRFAYFGLVVGAFTLMLLGKADTVLMEKVRTHVTDAFAPIMDVIAKPVSALSDATDKVKELTEIRVENARLREEKTRLLQWQTVARKMEVENKLLKDILNFVPDQKASFITGRVIADTGGAFVHSLVLNAGSRDGIEKGQAVITGHGLVGRIASTGRRSSRILLITDLNSRIPVVVESTRTRAILAGDNTDNPKLLHLPGGATISPGDRIVTSGHGGAFPPGLPVGLVVSVSDGGIGVQPFVERNRLEYVRAVDYGLSGILQLPDEVLEKSRPQKSRKRKK